MKLLVTGGTGFIGSHLVPLLVQAGHQVRVLVHHRRVEGVDSCPGDVTRLEEIEGFFAGVDAVIHLAALVGVDRTEVDPLGTLNINVWGTRNVAEACRRRGVGRLLFASSSEVYGEADTPSIRESDPFKPKSVYGVAKVAAEEFIRAYHQSHGLSFTLLRYFNVFGPGQPAPFVVPQFIKAILSGQPVTLYGNGEQVLSFCYVTDIARGTLLALTAEGAMNQSLNLGDDREPITMRELAERIGHLCGRPAHLQFIPLERTVRAKREIFHRVPNLEKAHLLLGYRPQITLSQGLADCIAWFTARQGA